MRFLNDFDKAAFIARDEMRHSFIRSSFITSIFRFKCHGPEVLSCQHNTFKIDILRNINSMHTPLAGLWNQLEMVKNLQLTIILPNVTLRAL